MLLTFQVSVNNGSFLQSTIKALSSVALRRRSYNELVGSRVESSGFETWHCVVFLGKTLLSHSPYPYGG